MSKSEAFELAAAIYNTHPKLRPEPRILGNGDCVVQLKKKWQHRWVVIYLLWSPADWEDYLKGSVAA